MRQEDRKSSETTHSTIDTGNTMPKAGDSNVPQKLNAAPKNTRNTKLSMSNMPQKYGKSTHPRAESSVTSILLRGRRPSSSKIAPEKQNLDHKKLSHSPSNSNNSDTKAFQPYASGLDNSGRRYLAVSTGAKEPLVFALEDIATRGIQSLNRLGAGMLTRASQNSFIAGCEEVSKQKPTFKVISAAGLDAGAEHFVFGSDIVKRKGAAAAYVSLDSRVPSRLTQQFKVLGTLEGWQQIAERARGNQIFLFLLSLGFVGPVNALMGHVNSSYMLYGRAGSGKTALSSIVSSAYGWSDATSGATRLGFGLSLNRTVNALEHALASRRHTFAFLDETALQGGEDLRNTAASIKAMIYKFEDGISKQRLTEVDGPLNFQVPVLLTSNHSVRELSAHLPQPFERQDYDRMIDIGVPDRPSGVFDTLHGFENLGALICHLSNIAAENHGVAGRRFVKWLLDRRAANHEELAQKVETYETQFITNLQKDKRLRGTEGFDRVIRSFARVFTAGTLARHAGVLPLTHSEIGTAVLSCCVNYLQRQAEPSAALQRPHSPLLALKQFIGEEASKLPMLTPDLSLAEVTKIGAFSGASGEVLLTLAKFDALVGGSREGKRLRRDLERAGAIGCTRSGKGATRKSVRHLVGAHKQPMDLIQVKCDRLKALAD